MTGGTAIEVVGLPVEALERLRRAGVSTIEQVAELGVAGLAALRLPVGDLRRTLAVLSVHELALREAPRVGGRPGSAGPIPDRDSEIASSRARGDTLHDIGMRFGIGKERVRQILVEQQAVDADTAKTARAERDVAAVWLRREEVVHAFRTSGHDPKAIAKELGLPPAAVSLLLDSHATAADWAAWRLARAETRPTKAHARHADADVIEVLKHVAESAGRVPSNEDYDRIARTTSGLPSRETIKNRFGGWNAALRAAGLKPRETQRAYDLTWTEERCLDAIRRLAKELGELPAQREYDRRSRGREDLPSMGTVRKYLGTWSRVALRLETKT